MNNRTRKLLFDISDSAHCIRDWSHNRTFADYEMDRQFRRAVEREFEVVGEALNRLSHEDLETANHISQLSRIVGFRNRIIHGYDAIDNATVWGIIKEHLNPLLAEVDTLLQNTDENR